MRRRNKLILAVLVVLGLGLAAAFSIARQFAVPGVHTEQASVPDPGNPSLHALVFYAEHSAAGSKRPLIVISHGTGGSGSNHFDTAAALAKAGFIVVAIDHTGDNYRDLSNVGKGKHLAERPRHISRTIDFMLRQWPRHDMIDSSRIGMFGHSAGGFTALVIAGANPDLSRGAAFCRQHPQRWTCQYVREQGLSLEGIERQATIVWHHDNRVKAIVIAAPAVGYAFDSANLSDVKLPVQLWAAGHDDIVDDSAERVAKALPVAPDYHALPNAGHFSFLMPCNFAMHAMIEVMGLFGTEAVCTDPAGFDRREFHNEFNAKMAAFFRATLKAN